MNTVEVHRARTRLDSVFESGKPLLADPELQGHWARYLCVLVSGYLEVAVQALYAEYARNNATPTVSSYVKSQLNGFRNPSMEKILAITRAFSDKWAEELEQAAKDQLKSSVDSIVAVRHKIAHGQNVGISYSIIRQYYADAVELIDLIEEQCRR